MNKCTIKIFNKECDPIASFKSISKHINKRFENGTLEAPCGTLDETGLTFPSLFKEHLSLLEVPMEWGTLWVLAHTSEISLVVSKLMRSAE